MEYDLFYKEVRSFLLDHKLSSSDNLQGIENDEIEEIENFIGKSLPIAIQSFLRVFGKKMKIMGRTGFPIAYNFNKIKYAYQEENRCNRATIKNIIAYNNTPIIEPITDIVLLGHNEVSYIFDFVSVLFDDPIVYYYYGEDEIITNNCKFTDLIRWGVVIKVLDICRSGNWDAENNEMIRSLLELEWVRFYFDRRDDKKLFINDVPNRHIFLELMYYEKSSRLYSINEWENMFTKFIK